MRIFAESFSVILTQQNSKKYKSRDQQRNNAKVYPLKILLYDDRTMTYVLHVILKTFLVS